MSTAIAEPNIALIKYWGKIDEALIIPATDSISLTLDGFPTTTTVTLTALTTDTATLNAAQLQPGEMKRITQVLDRIRSLSGSDVYAHVESLNTIPTAAGLASSASGFAALATAAAHAYGLRLDRIALSRLARLGSGSASRSLFDGMVRWHRGTDDASSHAAPLEWQGPELSLVIATLNTQRKAVSSRAGMTRTTQTSPFYEGWVTSNQQLVERALGAVADGDVRLLGELTELSTMRMHASMLGAEPPIRYLTAQSFAVFDEVAKIRSEGMTAYATADAGPNVKILTCREEADLVIERLRQTFTDTVFLTSGTGRGAYLVDGSDA